MRYCQKTPSERPQRSGYAKPTLVLLFAFGVVSTWSTFGAEPTVKPNPTVDASDADRQAKEHAFDRQLARMTAESASDRKTLSPFMLEPMVVSKFEWKIMQAKLDLLTGSVDDDFRLIGDGIVSNPGIDPEAFLEAFAAPDGSLSGGFLFWKLKAPSFISKDDSIGISLGALHTLGVIVTHVPDAHVNLHCIVITVGSPSGDDVKRYVTFDSDDRGNILPPRISATPPRASRERRNEIEKLFQARDQAGLECLECLKDKARTCEEYQKKFRELDSQIPGTRAVTLRWLELAESAKHR